MDSAAIKLEPGTSAEESVAVILTEIGVEYPFIKKEYPESLSDSNSGQMSSTEPSNLKGITMKPSEISYTEEDLGVPRIKKEYFKPSERIHHAAGSINVETVEVEPGPQEEVRHILFPDVNKECSERSERFNQTADLLTNLKTSGRKRYSCSLCKYSCSYESTLKLHLRTHTGEKPFSCSYCNYSCSTKGRLNDHLQTHGGDKPFTCPDCNYSCYRKGVLKSHMFIHSAEKPFSCANCKYSCSTKGRLKDHLLTHSGDKPFSCPVCNYSCYRKGDLKIHMFSHGGEKPFSCPDCNFFCSTKGHLKIHMFSHTGEKPFSCPYCNYSCSTKGNLKVHVLTHRV